MPFQLPELPYAKDALVPHMSAETLDFHYGKHHQAYVTKTNELISADAELRESSLARVIREANRTGQAKLFNNSAQLWNHSFFWQCLAPAQGQQPSGKLAHLIDDAFGSADAMRRRFRDRVATRFFPRHGIELLGVFAAPDEDGRLTYITRFTDEDARKKYPNGWNAPKPYLRIVPQPK